MPAALPRGDLAVDVPRQLWRRGGRPIGGIVLRVGFAVTFLVLALAIPDLTTRLIFIAAAVAVLVFLNVFMDRRLEAIAAVVETSDRASAARLLAGLEKRRVVALFAPHAWVALQRGRLHLRLGNDRAAAKAIADCGRMIGQPHFPAVVSGQAHALTRAGDRKEAKGLLAELDASNMLSDRDRLDYGIVLLEDPSKAAQARAYLERAYAAFGGHPRVLAGLALALVRTGEGEKAVELLKLVEESDDLTGDDLAGELLKRARKAARPILEAHEKRARKQRPTADAAERGGAATPARAEKREQDEKRDRRDRRKERREKRRAAKDGKATTGRPTTEHVQPTEAALLAQAPARADEEAKRLADEEANRRADEAAKRLADEEAKRLADEEAKRLADEEAKRLADEEAKRRADEEAKRRADEEAKRRAAEEAKRRADEEAKRRAAEEAKRRADEEGKRRADEEAKRRADEEAKRLAGEEAKRRADEEAKRRADEEAKRRVVAAGPPDSATAAKADVAPPQRPTPSVFAPPPLPPSIGPPPGTPTSQTAAPTVRPPTIAKPEPAAPAVRPPAIAKPEPAAPAVRPPTVAKPETPAPAIDAGWDEFLTDDGTSEPKAR